MSWNLQGTTAAAGDLAELVGLSHKHFMVELKVDEEMHTHRGVVRHNDLIGLPWGSQIFSHNGSPFFLLQPQLGDILRDMPRNTQILYPKEIGYILVMMGIGPGTKVIEAGTGSGSFTTALAYNVGANGHIFSYDVRQDMQSLAKKNLDRAGLSQRVSFKNRDVAEGFEESGVDALFLDLPNPYDYIQQVRASVKPGGFFGCILPTVNQVIRLLPVLRNNDFAFIDVCEILMRYYKPEADRFRPVDRMVAHTGFLIFARPVIIDPNKSSIEEVDKFEDPRFDN